MTGKTFQTLSRNDEARNRAYIVGKGLCVDRSGVYSVVVTRWCIDFKTSVEVIRIHRANLLAKVGDLEWQSAALSVAQLLGPEGDV